MRAISTSWIAAAPFIARWVRTPRSISAIRHGGDADLDDVAAAHRDHRPAVAVRAATVRSTTSRSDSARELAGSDVEHGARPRRDRADARSPRPRTLVGRSATEPTREPGEIGLGIASHQASRPGLPAARTLIEPTVTLLFISTGMRRSSSVIQITSRPLFLKMPPALRIGSIATQSNVPAGVSIALAPEHLDLERLALAARMIVEDDAAAERQRLGAREVEGRQGVLDLRRDRDRSGRRR